MLGKYHSLNPRPPYSVVDLKTGEEKQYPILGDYGQHEYYNGGIPTTDDPGFYLVCGTGCHYVFFDGNRFWGDENYCMHQGSSKYRFTYIEG